MTDLNRENLSELLQRMTSNELAVLDNLITISNQVDREKFPYQAGGTFWTSKRRYEEHLDIQEELDRVGKENNPLRYLDLAKELVMHGWDHSARWPRMGTGIPEEILAEARVELAAIHGIVLQTE